MGDRSSLRRLGVAAAILASASLLRPPAAEAQQSQADCYPGWVYANGQCVPPPNAQGGNMDAACQATARFDYCQASVLIGCQSWRSTYACRLLQLSRSNPRGFQQIMTAQRSCNLDGNRQACAFLQQFRGVYY